MKNQKLMRITKEEFAKLKPEDLLFCGSRVFSTRGYYGSNMNDLAISAEREKKEISSKASDRFYTEFDKDRQGYYIHPLPEDADVFYVVTNKDLETFPFSNYGKAMHQAIYFKVSGESKARLDLVRNARRYAEVVREQLKEKLNKY